MVSCVRNVMAERNVIGLDNILCARVIQEMSLTPLTAKGRLAEVE